MEEIMNTYKDKVATSEFIEIIEFGFQSKQFTLNCQPIVPLKEVHNNDYYEYEVLLATKDKDSVLTDARGHSISASLNVIIKTLEDNGMSEVMDEFVIKNVIEHISSMPVLIRPSIFHINLSGASLNNELFMSRVLSSIRTLRNNNGRLSFELTETACINSLELVSNFITEAQSYGCEFSLDDFGKGYSSFHYLINVPVDRIKIDGYYIKKMQKNTKAMAIVKSLVYLARELNLKTVAECIEDKTEYEIVKFIGVDYGQGWFFPNPIIPLKDSWLSPPFSSLI
jgi:EAL domain-containing protein (putative c-di-GMP-specific phosphodiesterase class I)